MIRGHELKLSPYPRHVCSRSTLRLKRTEASRLGARLSEYYLADGKSDPMGFAQSSPRWTIPAFQRRPLHNRDLTVGAGDDV
jgi:hypothetical protein